MIQKVANTDLLDGVAVFVGVINAGSFTAAARALGHSTSYVSKEITRLEKRLGSRFLNASLYSNQFDTRYLAFLNL